MNIRHMNIFFTELAYLINIYNLIRDLEDFLGLKNIVAFFGVFLQCILVIAYIWMKVLHAVIGSNISGQSQGCTNWILVRPMAEGQTFLNIIYEKSRNKK